MADQAPCFGCSRCRFSAKGCDRCRAAHFKPRGKGTARARQRQQTDVVDKPQPRKRQRRQGGDAAAEAATGGPAVPQDCGAAPEAVEGPANMQHAPEQRPVHAMLCARLGVATQRQGLAPKEAAGDATGPAGSPALHPAGTPAANAGDSFLQQLQQRMAVVRQVGDQQPQQQLLSPVKRRHGSSAQSTPATSGSRGRRADAGAAQGQSADTGPSPSYGTPAAHEQDGTGQQGGGTPKARAARPPASSSAYAGLWAPGDPDPRSPTWAPPQSPYGLLEEELWQDPWRLLLACMLLNKTTAKQVRLVIWRLFELCPTPQAAVDADVLAIQDIIQPLGLFRKRAVAIQRFSADYLDKQWTCPTQLHGIGKYGADAYYMFCRGAWQRLAPEDKDLRRYHEYLQRTEGLGQGLQAAGPSDAGASAGAAGAAEVAA